MHEAWMLFASHVHWMGWNLILAFVPLAIGAGLFEPATGAPLVGGWALPFSSPSCRMRPT